MNFIYKCINYFVFLDMESKVCKVVNSKRNHSGDEEDNRDSKPKRRHSSRDRYSTRDKYNKSERKYEELKIGDPYYSGGIGVDNRRDEDRFKDESRHKRRHRSKDRHEKENKSRNIDDKKEEKIGAPYYSGGIAAIERESGEETDNEDDAVGQRYYSTDMADIQRKNSESYWNKYAKKDKKQDVCTISNTIFYL